MRNAIVALLLIAAGTASAASVSPSGCPSCIQNTATPQNAQMNIGTATIRGTLTAGTLDVTNLSITNLTVTEFVGGGVGLTGLNASNLGSGTVPSARVAGAYTGITSVGALTAGTWTATAVGTQYGGTGQNLSAAGTGSLPYFSNTGVVSTLAAGAANRVLQANGASAPSWTASPTVAGTNVTQIPLANLLGGNLPQNVAVNDASISTVAAVKIIGNISGGAATLTVPLPVNNIAGGTLATSVVASSITVISGLVPGTYPATTSRIPIVVARTDGRIGSISQADIILPLNQLNTGTLPAGVLIPAANVQAGALGSSVVASSLTQTGAPEGTFGDVARTISLTMRKDGRASNVTQQLIALPLTQLNAGTLPSNVLLPAASVQPGTLGNSVVASSIAASGVTAGTYGGPTLVPQFTLGRDGRVTNATQFTIAGATAAVYANRDNAWNHSQTSLFGSSWTIHGTLEATDMVSDTVQAADSMNAGSANIDGERIGAYKFFSGGSGSTRTFTVGSDTGFDMELKADGIAAAPVLGLYGYGHGSTILGTVALTCSGGSQASPNTGCPSGSGQWFSLRGYNGSGVVGSRAVVELTTVETWAPGANGTQINLYATATGQGSKRTIGTFDETGIRAWSNATSPGDITAEGQLVGTTLHVLNGSYMEGDAEFVNYVQMDSGLGINGGDVAIGGGSYDFRIIGGGSEYINDGGSLSVDDGTGQSAHVGPLDITLDNTGAGFAKIALNASMFMPNATTVSAIETSEDLLFYSDVFSYTAMGYWDGTTGNLGIGRNFYSDAEPPERLTVDGSALVYSSVTASAFFGDGSHLDGIVGADLFRNVFQGNLYIGGLAGADNVDGSNNVAIANGDDAGSAACGDGSTSVCIGVGTGISMTSDADSNFLAGHQAGIDITSGQNNIYIGRDAGSFQDVGNHNVGLGRATLFNNNGSSNTAIGSNACGNMDGSGNVCLGYSAGDSVTASNQLYIDISERDDALIRGDFSARTLTFNGAVTFSSSTNLGNNSLTTTSTVTAFAFYGDGTHITGLAPGSSGDLMFTDGFDVLSSDPRFNYSGGGLTVAGSSVTASGFFGDTMILGGSTTPWYYCTGSTAGTYDGNLARGNSNAGACAGGTWVQTRIKSD